jgi:hypothetical protein
MNKTVWKPQKEIAHQFRDINRVTIFSCCFCANLSGTGGERGIRIMKRMLKDLNVKVVRGECVLVCCEENVMRQSIRRYRRSLAKSDALVVLSCAAGVKSAFLGKPGLPIICPLNPVGSAVVSHADDPVARGVCTVCGTCVISYTGGICPVSECPMGTRYGPCENADDNQGECYMRPGVECVWKEIERRADTEKLGKLKLLHREIEQAAGGGESGKTALPAPRDNPRLASTRSLLAWFGARLQSIEKLVAIYR